MWGPGEEDVSHLFSQKELMQALTDLRAHRTTQITRISHRVKPEKQQRPHAASVSPRAPSRPPTTPLLQGRASPPTRSTRSTRSAPEGGRSPRQQRPCKHGWRRDCTTHHLSIYLYHTHICLAQGIACPSPFQVFVRSSSCGARAGRHPGPTHPAHPAPRCAIPRLNRPASLARAGEDAGPGAMLVLDGRGKLRTPCVAGHAGAQRRARCRGCGCGPLDGRVRRAGLHWPGAWTCRHGGRRARCAPRPRLRFAATAGSVHCRAGGVGGRSKLLNSIVCIPVASRTSRFTTF